ncbi:hypothetical protein FC71_GL001280 [Latilactobacillus sakei subsp. carnosus DSM 15831]|nr:hypothetical protein FC71_GL001280 [Latilactobacillus sakei subsp. carnosus DSM 15831]
MMTDLYIETPTQANYDALMRLAEAAGYVWRSGCKPTEKRNFGNYEREPVVLMRENASLEYRYKSYYEGNQDITIETIPNLANIKAIWKVQPDDHKAFFKGKSYKHPLPSDESVIMLEMTDELAEGLMDIYKALAVEYKPQESKAMSEKVKLPKFVCDWLKGFEKDYPLNVITKVNCLRKLEQKEVSYWLSADVDNQWLLIDALRYGYEAEPEPRWGIKAGSYYLNEYDTASTKFTDMQHAKEFGFKSNAFYYIDQLGFGEVVDLNEEGKADE